MISLLVLLTLLLPSSATPSSAPFFLVQSQTFSASSCSTAFFIKNTPFEAGEMAQLFRVPAALAKALSSGPRSYTAAHSYL